MELFFYFFIRNFLIIYSVKEPKREERERGEDKEGRKTQREKTVYSVWSLFVSLGARV